MRRGGTPAWVAEGVSRRGSSHDRNGAPNQDAFAVATVGHALVAAVADGHGGRRYVRSQRGSVFAVQLAVDLGRDLLSTRRPDPESSSRVLPSLLLPAWRAAVAADLATDPLTPEEIERAGDVPTDLTILYGATLIVAFACGEKVSVAQIGDGSAIGGTGATVLRLVPGDARLVANETTSLCLPTALNDFRWGSADFPDDEPSVLLSTDGYGNSFASDDWEHEVMTDLTGQVREHGFEQVAASLDGWAAESADVGGDDVTLVLLHRQPAGSGQRSAVGRVIVGGLAMVALATVATLALGQRGDAPDTAPTVPVVGTTSASVPTAAPPTTTATSPTRTTHGTTTKGTKGVGTSPSGGPSTPRTKATRSTPPVQGPAPPSSTAREDT